MFAAETTEGPHLMRILALGKTVLHEICVSGTVLWSPTNTNSPTYMYIALVQLVNISKGCYRSHDLL